jgi:hypothetical protein
MRCLLPASDGDGQDLGPMVIVELAALGLILVSLLVLPHLKG